MNGNYILGLDIGIASVGYGVIDESQNIIDAGVRLFPEADSSENEARRVKRGARRLKRRRKHRKQRFSRLMDNYGLTPEAEEYSNPYYIRVKGLKEHLTVEELNSGLAHLIKRRGVHNVRNIDNDDAEVDNTLSTKEQIAKNEKELKEKHVCELQVQRLEEDGEIRGHSNRFKTEDYVKEAKAILKKQQEYYDKITNEFIQEFLAILENRREYFEGPGDGSQYGWDQDINKWYEQMVGRCSYFPEELRSVRESYTAQLFNVLNDLNNLTLTRDENNKLATHEKENLIANVFKIRKNPTLKQIAKELQINEEDIKGFRTNKNQQPEFTALKIYHDIKKITSKEEVLEADVLDEISKICTVWQTSEDRQEELKKLELNLDTGVLKQISELNYSGTHSLSLKAIKLVLPELWSTTQNQMEVFANLNLKPKKISLEGKNKIPDDHIEDLILSPVVKRSFKQSIRVVNEIIKIYGQPSSIHIELAREKNSQDQKNFISKLQKQHAAINQQVREKLEEKDLDADKGHFEKIRLWHLQDGLCLYSLQSISIEDLLENPHYYEIDHIIPRSISFDDSQNNKVLVKMDENQKKSNKTPFQYLTSSLGEISYDKFKSHILQMAKSKEKIPRKKMQYLLEERDINKFDIQKEFINRNLVDTRYATRELLNLLQSYFQENDKSVKIKSINGSFTHYLRKLWKFKKDRDEDFKHHAEDALVVAMAGFLLENKKELIEQNDIVENNKRIDAETGEILEENQFDALFAEQKSKVDQIKNYKEYKYSHRVDMKPNRQLMDETIYSTRKYDGEEYIIRKIDNIYDNDKDQLVKQVKKDPTKLLMYKNDPKTFDKLKNVMERYAESKNPLAKYKEETGEYLTKYSKKGNGPAIKSIKYQENKLGTFEDLSDNYNSKNKRVVALHLNSFRMDVFKEAGEFKIVSVRYNDLIEKKQYFEVDRDRYNEKLINKKINSENSFLFSVYKNNIITLNNQKYRFVGVVDDKANRIEVKEISFYHKYRLRPTVGKKTSSLRKINTDVLGNHYRNENEKIKYSYKK